MEVTSCFSPGGQSRPSDHPLGPVSQNTEQPDDFEWVGLGVCRPLPADLPFWDGHGTLQGLKGGPAGPGGWKPPPGHGPSPRGGAAALVMDRVNGKGLFPSKGKTKLCSRVISRPP